MHRGFLALASYEEGCMLVTAVLLLLSIFESDGPLHLEQDGVVRSCFVVVEERGAALRVALGVRQRCWGPVAQAGRAPRPRPRPSPNEECHTAPPAL